MTVAEMREVLADLPSWFDNAEVVIDSPNAVTFRAVDALGGSTKDLGMVIFRTEPIKPDRLRT